jgi:hypothetical protein
MQVSSGSFLSFISRSVYHGQEQGWSSAAGKLKRLMIHPIEILIRRESRSEEVEAMDERDGPMYLGAPLPRRTRSTPVSRSTIG